MQLRSKKHLALWAAIAVLQAPLCAVACIETSNASAPGSSATATDEMPPCHQAPETPGEPDESHNEDCGCSGVDEAVLTKAEQATTHFDFDAPPSVPRVVEPMRVAASAGQTVPQETDLPPPDILLLTSTLLL